MNQFYFGANSLRKSCSPLVHIAQIFLSTICVIGLMLLILVQAQAQTYCIPRGDGVPGLPGPPNWFESSPPNPREYRDVIDDPRWRGALGIPHGTGGATDGEARFRGLYASEGGTTYLYLSWHIKVDPSALSVNDRFFVGFSNSAGTLAIALRISPFDSPACRIALQPLTVNAHRLESGSLTAITSPPWADNSSSTPGQIRVWSTNGTAACATPSSWAVHMRVPTTGVISGLDLGTDFRMFYEVRLDTPGGLRRHKWPSGAPDVTQSGGVFNFGNPATDWAVFHLRSGSSDPSCTASGVSLAVLDVGTENTDPNTGLPAAHTIQWNTNTPVSTRPVNTIYARPFNETTTTTIAALRIKARFRLANWGSIATSAPWVEIPGGGAVTHSASIGPGVKGNLTFTWQLNDMDIGDFITGKPDHQCMLVELSSVKIAPTDPDIVFVNDSVYRNMDFVEASNFSRVNEINIAGLNSPPTIGAERDVYLYVQTLNMPSSISSSGTDAFAAVVGRCKDPHQAIGPNEVAMAIKSGQLDESGLDKVLPTYRVFVYHDTGIRQTINNVIYPILESQPSFGFYMTHEGSIEGWRHTLQGAEQIAPNFYRIKIPNNGKANVTTTIEAIESPLSPGTVCLQDDRSGNTLRFNTSTGEYTFTKCGGYTAGGFTINGRGNISRKGCDTMLKDAFVDAVVHQCPITPSKITGSATIRNTRPGTTYKISDRDLNNNTCKCTTTPNSSIRRQ